MKALDLFCKAGGATRGLQQAGCYVTGVDIAPQPRYCGDRFFQDDAMVWLRNEREPLSSFELIWASPPCQGYSRTQRIMKGQHPDLIAEVRALLITSGRPYIIENVLGAPLKDPVLLVGSMFGLKTMRPRLFECSFKVPFLLAPTPAAPHAKMGRRPKAGEYIHVVGNFTDMAYAKAAMGIDWMVRSELAEAIPPAYSEYLAEQLREAEIERILAMTDEEILAECVARGEDPEEIAGRGRCIFERAVAQVNAESAMARAPQGEPQQ